MPCLAVREKRVVGSGNWQAGMLALQGPPYRKMMSAILLRSISWVDPSFILITNVR